MFIVFKAKKVFVLLIIMMIGIFVYLGTGRVENAITVTSDIPISPSRIIVVDAGHGEPDGGATSKEGIREAHLNLLVASKIRDLLEEENFEVIMTREKEENIGDSDKQSTIRKMKVSDIQNRVNLINNSNADMTVSIHMNKFASEKYYGWQTFYSKNSKSGKIIAEKIQKGICQNIERENKRVALPISGIKIVDSTTIPVIIVECGFLSNNDDVALLQTKEYREKIAIGIVSRNNRFL